MKKIGAYFKSIPGRIVLVLILQWAFFFIVFISSFCIVILSFAINDINFNNLIGIINIANVMSWTTLGILWAVEIILASIGRSI